MNLEQVVDELSIRRLVDTFCDGVNSRDSTLWGSVWDDEDATFCLGGTDRAGKDAIIAGFAEGIAAYEMLVQVAPNGRIEIDGDTATGRWYILELGQLRDGSSRSWWRCAGTSTGARATAGDSGVERSSASTRARLRSKAG